MPLNQALAGETRALASNGRATVGDPNCPCCGQCALWRRLLQCQTGPSDCVTNPPPPVELWVCTTVTCQYGSPLLPGQVVKIDQFCFVVQPQTSTNPPVSQRITGVSTLLCVQNGCFDSICPQGNLYWRGEFCSGDPRPIWICGVPPGCHVRGCIIVDGGTTPVTFEQIPPDPDRILLRFGDMGTPSSNCCNCQPGGVGRCLPVPLLDFDPQGVQCVNAVQRPCCCTIENGEPTTTFHITRWHVEQIHIRPSDPPDFSGTIVGDLTNECAGIATFHVDGLFRPPGGETYVGPSYPFSTSCYRRCPGNWSAFLPRLRGVNGFPIITEGNFFSEGCENIDFGGGQTLEVVRFYNDHTNCNQVRHFSEYRYVDIGNNITIITRFEYTAGVTGENPCGDPCDSLIGNGNPQVPDGEPPSAPNAPFQDADDVRFLIV